MRDGLTRKKPAATGRTAGTLEEFLKTRSSSIVVVSGPDAGLELRLDTSPLVIGRGPGVHLTLRDPQASRQHASLEFHGSGFRVKDLGSTNGIRLRGVPVQVADLRPGDRFELGGHVLEYVVVDAAPEPDVYVLSSEV